MIPIWQCMGNSKGMPTTLTREGSDFSPSLFFWLVFIPTTLNHYSLAPVIQIMLTFCLSTFPFSSSLNTHQSPKRSGTVYESLFLTQFFSVLCNLWNSASGEKSQSHFPSSRIGKSQFSEPSVIKQLLLKCSSYKFWFSFCCCCCCFFNIRFCPKCRQRREASKTIQIWRLPAILVVHLKRLE